MDREIIPISKNKCCVTILIPLGFNVDNTAKKMECEQLTNCITAIAKDLHIDYAVRANGNIRTAEISFTHEGRVTSEDEYKYEIKAIEFMKQIEKLDLPNPATEPECPSHENATKNQEDVEFVKALLKEVVPNKNMRVIVAEIVPSFIPGTCIRKATISTDLLREMCKIYLESYHEFDYDKS